jgi:hypothetical protein
VFVVTARRVFNHMKIIDLGTCKTGFPFFVLFVWLILSLPSQAQVSVAILRPTRTGSIPLQTYYPGPTGLQFQPQALPPRSGRD